MTEEIRFEVVEETLNINFQVDQIGPQGPKPKKGTDYWTEADRAEISAEIDRKTQTAAAPALQAAGNAVTIAEGAREKADEAKSQVQGHENDVGIHVTPREKDTWDSKAPGDHTHDVRYYTKAQTDAAIAAEKAERMAADGATGRALEEETTARQNAFAESERQIQAEREARAAADTEMQTAINGKQPTLTAGDHITISGNVISAEVPEAPVTDVTINGTSIVDGGVAEVPIAKDGVFGAVRLSSWNRGIGLDGASYLGIKSATSNDIPNRTSDANSAYKPIVTGNLDHAVKAAMCDGKGAAWTDAEKAAARARIGLGNFELIADETISEETSVFMLNNIHLRRVKIILQSPSGGASLKGGVMISGSLILGGLSNLTAGNGTRVIDVSAEYGMLTTLTSFFSTPSIDGYTGNLQTGNAGLALAKDDINSIRIDISGGNFTIGTTIKIYGVRA